MTTIQKNKIKATFILAVFAFNTVVAFACSVGLNMGYNTKHHQEMSEEHHSSHTRNDNHKATAHEYNEGAATDHHEESTPGKDDCCNQNAVQLQQVDKSLSHAAKIAINPPVLLFLVKHIYNIGLHHFSDIAIKQYYFVQSDHPPISDIRIAIQSFQI